MCVNSSERAQETVEALHSASNLSLWTQLESSII